MEWPCQAALAIGLAVLLLNPSAASAAVPVSYITEEVSADYYYNGSLASPVQRLGYVQVEVPDTSDVLQYLVMNLSGTSGTDLQDTKAYKDVAASPNPGDRTPLFLNTSQGSSSLSYQITNTGITPVMYLQMGHDNQAGGKDLFSGGKNYLNFTVLMNSTLALSGVQLRIMFARNTMGINDSMHIYSASSTSGIAIPQDSDSDGMYDTLYWTGDLSSDVGISFSAETLPGASFDEALMYVDLDQGTTSQASRQSSGTYTGITFTDRFSRGPIREGIEMLSMQNWVVRGFIRNMAQDLDYRVHGWGLYKVGQSSPLSSSSGEVYPFVPGQTEYTEWYDTGVPGIQDKAGYYSTLWDWEAAWGSSTYSARSLATITLPSLYEIAAWADKAASISSNTESGTGISMQDTVRHIGHSSMEADQVTIYSSLPGSSSGGVPQAWSPSGFTVLYISNGTQSDITSQVSVTSQASGSGPGYVQADIPDVPSVIGHGLLQNEEIRFEYSVNGPAKATSQDYSFCQTSTLVTASGTPVSESSCQDVTVPGIGGEVKQPGGGGGGGGTVEPARYADIERELGQAYFLADNLVRLTAAYRIIDTGTLGVQDIRAVIYVPEHGSLDESSMSFRVFDASRGTWEELSQGSGLDISDNGMTLVEGKPSREYIVKKASSGGIFEEGMSLGNNDKVEISYLVKVPVGTSMLVTRLAGYVYYDNRHIFEDIHVPVRREGVLQDLEVNEGVWSAGMAYVGSPVRWLKEIEVSNPNNVPAESSVSFEVFPDSLSVHLVSGDGERQALGIKQGNVTYVDAIISMGPGESRTFLLEASTPPVMEVRRSVDVLDSSEREIIFLLNMTLRSFAAEGYSNVSYVLDVDPGKVLGVVGAMNYTGHGEGETEFVLGGFGPGESRDISVTYREVPPILIITRDALDYGCSDSADLNVIIIPSERESSAYLEVEVVGPEPRLSTVKANLVELRDIWPYEEVRVPIRLDISEYPDGKYRIVTRFMKSFQTILASQEDFYVNCPERGAMSISWLGFAAAAVAIAAFAAFRLRARRKEDELAALRKKLKQLR